MKSRHILIILSLFTLTISERGRLQRLLYVPNYPFSSRIRQICLNPDGTNTILSKSTQNQGITFISKILSGKRFEYKQSQFNLGYD